MVFEINIVCYSISWYDIDIDTLHLKRYPLLIKYYNQILKNTLVKYSTNLSQTKYTYTLLMFIFQ